MQKWILLVKIGRAISLVKIFCIHDEKREYGACPCQKKGNYLQNENEKGRLYYQSIAVEVTQTGGEGKTQGCEAAAKKKRLFHALEISNHRGGFMEITNIMATYEMQS